jgi:hypothetical protein
MHFTLSQRRQHLEFPANSLLAAPAIMATPPTTARNSAWIERAAAAIEENV